MTFLALWRNLVCTVCLLVVSVACAYAQQAHRALAETFEQLENGDLIASVEEYRRQIAALKSQIDWQDQSQRLRFQRLACWYQPDESMAQVQAAIAQADAWLAEFEGVIAAQAEFTLCRGWFYEVAGNATQARRDYNQALVLAENADDLRVMADALGTRAELLALQGELARALLDFQTAHHIYHSLGVRYWTSYYQSMIANTYRRMGDFRRARDLLSEVIAFHRQRGDAESAESSEYLLALTLDELGQYQRAAAIYRAQLEQSKEPLSQLSLYISLADNRQRAGLPGEACSALAQSEPLLAQTFDKDIHALWRLFDGGCLLSQGKPEAALAQLTLAESSLIEQENLRYLSWLQQLKAQALAATGQWQAAYQALDSHVQSEQALAQKQREMSGTREQLAVNNTRKELWQEALAATTRFTRLRSQLARERASWQWLVAGMVLLCVLLAGFLWRTRKRSSVPLE